MKLITVASKLIIIGPKSICEIGINFGVSVATMFPKFCYTNLYVSCMLIKSGLLL